MKKKLALLILTGSLLTTGGLVSAGTTYEPYSEIVPKFNGKTFTGQQKKATSYASANLKVSTLGKAIDAAEYGNNVATTGPWVRVSTLGTFNLPSKAPSGTWVSVGFSSDLTTSVDVLVSGTWRSN